MLVLGTLPELRQRSPTSNETSTGEASPENRSRTPKITSRASSAWSLALEQLRLANSTAAPERAAVADESSHWLFGCKAMLDGEVEVFVVVELLCIIWFTLEFVVRLVVSPSRRSFLIAPMNIIDLFSILPFYITIVMVHPLELLLQSKHSTSGVVLFSFDLHNKHY